MATVVDVPHSNREFNQSEAAAAAQAAQTYLVSAGTPLCRDMKLFFRLRCVRSWL